MKVLLTRTLCKTKRVGVVWPLVQDESVGPVELFGLIVLALMTIGGQDGWTLVCASLFPFCLICFHFGVSVDSFQRDCTANIPYLLAQ